MARLAYALISVAAILFGVALIVSSWGPLHNLFESYQDSEPGTYLIIGLPFLVIGLLCIFGGVWLAVKAGLSRRSRTE
jgi:hypothetical protein